MAIAERTAEAIWEGSLGGGWGTGAAGDRGIRRAHSGTAAAG